MLKRAWKCTLQHRAHQIALQVHNKNFENFQSTTRLPQQTWNHSYHTFHRKKAFFERTYDISFGNLTKSFKTVQTQNDSYCMSKNWWVIFVKMLHVFHSFIVPCIFSELKLNSKNLFKNTAWLSGATTGVVPPYPAWLKAKILIFENILLPFSVY